MDWTTMAWAEIMPPSISFWNKYRSSQAPLTEIQNNLIEDPAAYIIFLSFLSFRQGPVLFTRRDQR